MISVGTFIDEICTSLGKWNIEHKKENIYTFGFLNLFWGLVFFIVLAVVRDSFKFSLESLPLFSLLVILTMAQTFSSLEATVKADRSTFGFIMVGTIPLLLLADFLLGYDISTFHIWGVCVIVMSLLLLFTNHGLGKKGLGYVIFSTVNATFTISIYKYLITNYNSVEGQNIVMFCFIMLFLFIMAVWRGKENPIPFIFKRGFFFQGLGRGIAEVLIGFAFSFAPASIITSAKRGLSVLWSIISGNKFFHENHVVIKATAFLMVIIGLGLLTV